MATYTVTPAQTIQAVFDGNDLAPGDIVELCASTPGGVATYIENVIVGSNDVGSAGNPVIIRGRAGDDITVTSTSGNYTVTHPFGNNYVKYQNVRVTSGLVSAFRLRTATAPEFVDVECTSTNALGIGLYIDAAVTDFAATRLSCTGSTGKGLFVNAACTGVINDSVFSDNGNHGVQGNLGGIAFTGCVMHGNGGHGHWSAVGTAVAQSLTLCHSHHNIATDLTYRHGFTFAPSSGTINGFTVDRCLATDVDIALDIQATSGNNTNGLVVRNILIAKGQGQTERGTGLFLGATNASYSNSTINIYHNLIATEDELGAGLFVGRYNNGNIKLRNNIIANLAGGNVYACTADAPYLDSDYNIFFSTKAKPFKIGNTDYTFAEYQTLSGTDAHSIMLTVNPLNADYTLNSTAVYAQHAAEIITGVNDSAQADRWGNTTPTYPNIGADQFDYAPGFGPWTTFDSTMPPLSLDPTCPGSLLEVQEWSKPVTKKQIDKASR